MTSSGAVLLVSHGSPEPQSNDQFLKFRDLMRAQQPQITIEGAFLEVTRPDFLGALQDLLAKGVTRVVVMPCFLFPGGHVSEDIPALIQKAVRNRSDATVVYGATFSEYPAAADILVEQIPAEILSGKTAQIILVAAGSIALANRETVERLTALIQERTGLHTTYGYLDQGEPLMETVLAQAVKGEAKSLVVLPCLLFQGVYMRKVERTVEGFSMSHPDVTVTVGSPFGLDPRLAEAVLQEAAKLLASAT